MNKTKTKKQKNAQVVDKSKDADTAQAIEKNNRFGWAIYAFIFVFALFLYLASSYVPDTNLSSSMRSLSTGFISAAFLFFLVKRFFKYDEYDEQRKQAQRIHDDVEIMLKGNIEPYNPITLYPTRKAGLDDCLNQIRRSHWENFRINAPVGLWSADEAKIQWVADVAECARKKQVRTIWGIFGLPPISRYGKTRDTDSIVADLNHFYRTLSPFINDRNAELHFYPPASASVGFGAFILENQQKTGGILAFGLASHGDVETVDTVFGIDSPELFLDARTWFDDKLFRKATGGMILHDSDYPMNLRWKDIVKNWYGEDYLLNLVMEEAK